MINWCEILQTTIVTPGKYGVIRCGTWIRSSRLLPWSVLSSLMSTWEMHFIYSHGIRRDETRLQCDRYITSIHMHTMHVLYHLTDNLLFCNADDRLLTIFNDSLVLGWALVRKCWNVNSCFTKGTTLLTKEHQKWGGCVGVLSS